MSTLKEYYNSTVAPAMMKKFGYENVMQIPKLDKVVVNVAAGEAKDNAKVIDAIMTDLAAITGQKPVVCRAKKSVANFKLREGMPIGVKVTLRGEKMYEFVYKLFNVSFPRVRDFRGINGNSFDGKGNYSTGIKEQLIFPEIEYDKVDKVRVLKDKPGQSSAIITRDSEYEDENDYNVLFSPRVNRQTMQYVV